MDSLSEMISTRFSRHRFRDNTQASTVVIRQLRPEFKLCAKFYLVSSQGSNISHQMMILLTTTVINQQCFAFQIQILTTKIM